MGLTASTRVVTVRTDENIGQFAAGDSRRRPLGLMVA